MFVCRLTVQKEGPNKGRTFYACAKGQNNGCNFFQWGDEVPPRDSNWSGGDNGMNGGRGGWTRGGLLPYQNLSPPAGPIGSFSFYILKLHLVSLFELRYFLSLRFKLFQFLFLKKQSVNIFFNVRYFYKDNKCVQEQFAVRKLISYKIIFIVHMVVLMNLAERKISNFKNREKPSKSAKTTIIFKVGY
uniref:GRF-type domain-containing protein n=1 Tax=Timema bartmani TaxID=61472 RepID=A0A7R9ERR8_9NEOP|nr:unnamed protein product [Timema bartmani]